MNVGPENIKRALTAEGMTSEGMRVPTDAPDRPGFRAAEAYVRPTPVATNDGLVSYGFDLRNCTFSMSLTAASSTKEDAPTVIFLPEFHFPPSSTNVEVSGGKWTISFDDENGGLVQMLRWWHAEGDQKITIRGVRRKQGTALSAEEDEGYLEQCQQRNCTVM